METEKVLLRIGAHLAQGAFGAVCFAGLLLAYNVGALRDALAAQPLLVIPYLLGAIFAFAPIVLCSLWVVLGQDG